MSTKFLVDLKIGVLAVKNTQQEILWLLEMLGAIGEPYRRGGDYDVVWMLNVVPEISFIRHHTDMKIVAVAMEPAHMHPQNYSPALLKLTDMYMGYRNFAGSEYKGIFRRFIFPVYPKHKVQNEFANHLKTIRNNDFCMFAAHDPNIRMKIAQALQSQKVILGGKLFSNYVEDKVSVQKMSRYEFITENEINDYYFSEKIGEAIFAGCVPIYFGSLTIDQHIPKSMYINLHAFISNGLDKGLENVISYCLHNETYNRYFAAISKNGQKLLGKFTHEKTMIEPFRDYLEQLKRDRFRSKYRSPLWRYSSQFEQSKKIIRSLADFGRKIRG